MLDVIHSESQDAEITDVLAQAQTLHFHFFFNILLKYIGGRVGR